MYAIISVNVSGKGEADRNMGFGELPVASDTGNFVLFIVSLGHLVYWVKKKKKIIFTFLFLLKLCCFNDPFYSFCVLSFTQMLLVGFLKCFWNIIIWKNIKI